MRQLGGGAPGLEPRGSAPQGVQARQGGSQDDGHAAPLLPQTHGWPSCSVLWTNDALKRTCVRK